MLHINAEGMYSTPVFRRSIYANLKQASTFCKEANVVLLSVILNVTGLQCTVIRGKTRGRIQLKRAEFSQLTLIIMQVRTNTHACFVFPLYLQQVHLDEPKKEKNISIPVFTVF